MRRAPTIIVAGIVILVLLMYMFTFQVRFTDTAVVLRFGRVVPERQVHSGLNFLSWPWPIEQVHIFDQRLQTFQTNPKELSTADGRTVVVTAFATWRISDAANFLQSNRTIKQAEPRISNLIESEVSNVLKRHPLSDFVNTDPERLQFAEVESEIRDRVNAAAARPESNYGVDVVSVGIARLELTENNVMAVAERMKEDRKAVSTRLETEGRAEGARIKSEAQKIAGRIRQRAIAYAKKIEGEGESLAARYISTFRENPELAMFLKKLESLSEILKSGESMIVIDSNTMMPPFDMLGDPQSLTPVSDKELGAVTTHGDTESGTVVEPGE